MISYFLMCLLIIPQYLLDLMDPRLLTMVLNLIRCHVASLIKILKASYAYNSAEILQRHQYE